MEISKSEGIKKQQKHSVAKSLMMINKLFTFFAASGFASPRYQLNAEGTNSAPLKLKSLLLCDFNPVFFSIFSPVSPWRRRQEEK